MATKENPIYTYNNNLNNTVKVYKNRVIITRGGLFRATEEVVLFRNIVSIELAGMTKKLVIHTQAGKVEVDWVRGGVSEKIRDAILENL